MFIWLLCFLIFYNITYKVEKHSSVIKEIFRYKHIKPEPISTFALRETIKKHYKK